MYIAIAMNCQQIRNSIAEDSVAGDTYGIWTERCYESKIRQLQERTMFTPRLEAALQLHLATLAEIASLLVEWKGLIDASTVKATLLGLGYTDIQIRDARRTIKDGELMDEFGLISVADAGGLEGVLK